MLLIVNLVQILPEILELVILALPKLLFGEGHCLTTELNLPLVSELYKLYLVINIMYGCYVMINLDTGKWIFYRNLPC